MGLDMYLYGKNKSEEIQLGYWRKHPDLHGFIVQTFANGVDECQKIPLTKKDLQTILEATEIEALPHTEGFFFGVSQKEDRVVTIDILQKAIQWMQDDKSKRVFYRASW